MSLFVKKGDTVLIIAGKDKGKTGKVTACDPEGNRVVVEGVNIITKHNKPRGVNQPGGINKLSGPIDASNVQVICPSCNKATRVSHNDDGKKKIRVCKKCGASLEAVKKVEKKPRKAAKAEESAEATEEKKTAKKTKTKTAKKVTETAESTGSEE